MSVYCVDLLAAWGAAAESIADAVKDAADTRHHHRDEDNDQEQPEPPDWATLLDSGVTESNGVRALGVIGASSAPELGIGCYDEVSVSNLHGRLSLVLSLDLLGSLHEVDVLAIIVVLHGVPAPGVVIVIVIILLVVGIGVDLFLIKFYFLS